MNRDRDRGRKLVQTLGLALALLGGALLSSCSTGGVDYDDCESSSECQAAFGFGYACGEDGFCREASSFDRCTERSYPADLFDRPELYADRLIVGVLMDRSSTTKQARENSIELALASANDQGGVLSQEFAAVFCNIEENSAIDTRDQVTAAIESARYLVDEIGVSAIVGPSGSGNTQAVFTALRDNGDDVVVISPSATSPALSGIDNTAPTNDNPGLLWRTAPPDDVQGQELARHVSEAGHTEAYFIYQDGSYGEGLALVFREAFQAAGGTVTLASFANDSALAEEITTAGTSAASVVLFASSDIADSVSFLNGAEGAGSYTSKLIFLTDSSANTQFVEETVGVSSALYPRIRGTRPAVPDGNAYTVFTTGYQSRFDADVSNQSFTAQSYDAAWMVIYGMAYAISQEGGVGGSAIASGFRRLADPAVMETDVIPSRLQGIVNSLSMGSTVNLRGASSGLDYDLTIEEITGAGAVELWCVSDAGGSFEISATCPAVPAP